MRIPSSSFSHLNPSFSIVAVLTGLAGRYNSSAGVTENIANAIAATRDHAIGKPVTGTGCRYNEFAPGGAHTSCFASSAVRGALAGRFVPR
jgi:hypothetical protein